jgi:phenylalanyl-tRNA synthetase alpha chain
MLAANMIDKIAPRNHILRMLKKKLQDLRNEAEKAIQTATTTEALYQVKVKYFGKQGALTLIMKDLKEVPAEERPLFGKLVNEVRDALTQLHDHKNSELGNQELLQQLAKEGLDLTLPGPQTPLGAKHLIPGVIDEIVDILSRIGFSVRSGPFIEDDYHNFTALNIPADHPSRDMQDTFYIDDIHVLRTHTSPVQIRTMETEKPPIRILAPGGVFRHDYDATHSPHFHQIEALLIDKKVSMADLKGTISFFIKEFFGKKLKTRFRPSFFPFTEPSAEVDCSCPMCEGAGCKLCKQTGWIEIGGSGLVHPHVLKSVGIDPKEWQGFAFGFGIERMAIIKYGINDIRLFMENDLRFLEQFRL